MLGRTIDFADGGVGFRLLLRVPGGVLKISPGMRAEQMRVGLRHFFDLAKEEAHGTAGFGEVIGAPKRPAIGAGRNQDTELAAQWLVASAIQSCGHL